MTNLVQGVGYNDTRGETRIKGGKHTRVYQLWLDVLKRCYNTKKQSSFPSYIGCVVSEDWKTFSKFKSDIEGMHGYCMENWRLDKDILVKNNKVYSKETCCFVPIEINATFIKGKLDEVSHQ